jgi:hypothetical protein
MSLYAPPRCVADCPAIESSQRGPDTSHNIHPLPKLNREWNKSQPPGTPPLVEKFDKEEFIPVKCNVHPWMHAYFAVLKTSHYSVTSDGGSFSLPNLPPESTP